MAAIFKMVHLVLVRFKGKKGFLRTAFYGAVEAIYRPTQLYQLSHL